MVMAKILVVDDDSVFCKRARLTLERGGHQVATTDSGRDALAVVIREEAELIVLDLSMPKMDGAIVLQVLRSYQRWRDLPVIIATANMEGEQFERVTKLGFQCAFDKTKLNFDDLLTCANALLAGKPCCGNTDSSQQ